MFSQKRKRPLWDGHEEPTSPRTKRGFSDLRSLRDRFPYRTSIRAAEECNPVDGDLSERLSPWTDTHLSVKKVLEHIRSKQAISNVLLSDVVTKKFLGFHLDITSEFGPEDKQHSWAVLEKQDEVIMYGLYYPNYNSKKHSEDVVIRQTQDLIESESSACEDWNVYVFSMNSPCLARKDEPCMLRLIHKAEEWWNVHRVKTHIAFVRSWGFKGKKENVFKDITYRQVECINQSVDYESYMNASGNDLSPVCENVFSVTKDLLMSKDVNKFPLTTTVQKQDRKGYFKNMHSVSEGRAEDDRTVLCEEIKSVIQAAEALLSGLAEMTLEEYFKRGQMFVCEHTFSLGVSDALEDRLRQVFQQCWIEMVEDMYAEFIRNRLTEAFNRRAVQMFVKDVLDLKKEYLHIGRLQLSEEEPKLL
ncbi:uncharacterized protein LOC114457863 isoform X2 [Gouania willdenowi]|uniref:uncharacterized protein LOC114457863 isoform X2 n=1 Tax=Gouania willdenowi TaxID=441366 RepID=UPI001056DAA6|nr:uncharacterized protein LOC114457863 isoform X2 [Gouania willdenowi]